MIRRAFPWRGASWPPPFWARSAAPWWARTRCWPRCCWPFWPGAISCWRTSPAWARPPWPWPSPGPWACRYSRVQFTPDVMPSDITGFSLYNKAAGPDGVPARRGAVQPLPGRRAQPRHQPHPVRPAGGHGGGAGDGGRRDPPGPPALPGHRHPEPDRRLGHAAAARLPAGPLHGAPVHGLPRPGGRAGDAAPPSRGAHPLEGVRQVLELNGLARTAGAGRTRSTSPTRWWTTSCAWWPPPGATP